MSADPARPVDWLWAVGDGPPQALARLAFVPLTPRRALPGLLLAEGRLGYCLIPGAGSRAVHEALRSGPGGRALPAPAQAAPWTDVSGAVQRFTLVADPVQRFVALFRRHGAAEAGSERPGWRALQAFVECFDERSPQADWGPLFRPQAEWVAEAAPDRVFSWQHPHSAERWLSGQLGRAVSLPVRPRGWLQRWGWGRPPRALEAWIQARYAADLALFDTAS